MSAVVSLTFDRGLGHPVRIGHAGQNVAKVVGQQDRDRDGDPRRR
jgi:hypothetical protein